MSTTAPPAVTPDRVALDLVALRVLADLVRTSTDQRKTAAATLMARGDRATARTDHDGRDVKLGTVTKTDPKRAARVTDRDAVEAWCAQHVTGAAVVDVEIADEAAAKAVLQEHAPHLLVDVPRVADWAVTAQLRRAEADDAAGREPTPPGIVVEQGTPTVSVRPSPEARDLVFDLIRRGVISLDTPLALPGGAA